MPQDQTDQMTERRADEAIIDEFRVLLRNVRTSLEAIVATGPLLSDIIASTQGATGLGGVVSGHPVPDPASERAELDEAVAALDASADALSVSAAHAADAVRERGDRIDAVLAEIRRVRAETVPV